MRGTALALAAVAAVLSLGLAQAKERRFDRIEVSGPGLTEPLAFAWTDEWSALITPWRRAHRAQSPNGRLGPRYDVRYFYAFESCVGTCNHVIPLKMHPYADDGAWLHAPKGVEALGEEFPHEWYRLSPAAIEKLQAAGLPGKPRKESAFPVWPAVLLSAVFALAVVGGGVRRGLSGHRPIE